jgi:hypothetical protein
MQVVEVCMSSMHPGFVIYQHILNTFVFFIYLSIFLLYVQIKYQSILLLSFQSPQTYISLHSFQWVCLHQLMLRHILFLHHTDL